MVYYYGRAKSRIGSVNTNQPGLKMAGCPSNVGRSGRLTRHVARRVDCNLKVCGYINARNGIGYRCRNAINFLLADGLGRSATAAECVQVDPRLNNTVCINPAPRTRASAGGVGQSINIPRLKCICSARPVRNPIFKTFTDSQIYSARNTG